MTNTAVSKASDAFLEYLEAPADVTNRTTPGYFVKKSQSNHASVAIFNARWQFGKVFLVLCLQFKDLGKGPVVRSSMRTTCLRDETLNWRRWTTRTLRAIPTPCLHHATKSLILFQNDGKDLANCDLTIGENIFRNSLSHLFSIGPETNRAIVFENEGKG
jgi:hypothetical protein